MVAVSRVLGIQGSPKSLDDIWPSLADSLEGPDRPFAQMLCYGSLRWWSNLEHRIASCLKKPLKQKDKMLDVLMVLGAFQLIFLRTPPHAAVFTSVEIAKRVKGNWAGALVNGVLRSIERSLAPEISDEELVNLSGNSFTGDPLGENLAVQFAHPNWMVDLIQQEWPVQHLRILEAAQSPGPLCVRVNESRVGRSAYLEHYGTGLSLKSAPYAESGIYVENLSGQVTDLPGFDEGVVSVQDEGAQLAIQAFSSAEPSTVLSGCVLDACAAPGGKSMHWLEKRFAYQQANDQPGGNVYVLDRSESRMTKVSENLARLQAHQKIRDQVYSVVADVADPEQWWEGQLFNAILLDVPCSGSGVMRRHPDIKWLRRQSDIAQFATQQSRILASTWVLLASEGLMLYCTCSLFGGENEQVIDAFLKTTDNAVAVTLNLPGTETLSHGVQKLPEKNGTDGFYFCLLKKLKDT